MSSNLNLNPNYSNPAKSHFSRQRQPNRHKPSDVVPHNTHSHTPTQNAQHPHLHTQHARPPGEVHGWMESVQHDLTRSTFHPFSLTAKNHQQQQQHPIRITGGHEDDTIWHTQHHNGWQLKAANLPTLELHSNDFTDQKRNGLAIIADQARQHLPQLTQGMNTMIVNHTDWLSVPPTDRAHIANHWCILIDHPRLRREWPINQPLPQYLQVALE